jgi:hypothetical protein
MHEGMALVTTPRNIRTMMYGQLRAGEPHCDGLGFLAAELD